MPMVALATVIVGLEVLSLIFVGTKVWANIFLAPAEANALQVDVQAGQFAFYFRYPGPDGKFGVPHPEKIDEGNGNFFGLDPQNDTAARDDIVSASLVVPVDRAVAADDALEGRRALALHPPAATTTGLRARAHHPRAFHGDGADENRDRVHAAVRARSLQHEGVPGSVVEE